MNLTKKKVLVTGAGGFIGSHLVEELVARGCQVRALVHYNSRNDWGNLERIAPRMVSEVEVIAGDVRDSQCVVRATKGCVAVFHLAALIGIPYSYSAPESYVSTNVSGTLNVLRAALECGVGKVVHTSTSETYGTAQYTPIDEGHPLVGQSPYAATKIAADKLAESFHLSFGLPVATIRPFNTFGPRQSSRAVIPTIITQGLAGNVVRLGAVSPVRDFNYVKDTVSGFIRIAESDQSIGEVMNIGSGKGITIGEVFSSVSRLLNKELDLRVDKQRIRPRKSEVNELICSYEKASRTTNYSPEFNFDTGLGKTIEYLKENFDEHKQYNYIV
ncbi:MAG: SDR family NAD(P)-dependent oxidoreductase [Chitinivibrionales bacterium]|nr:SDR family NAD(P)-dependent oxidoreductase [Chitinivibrionales bacterium]MBD3358606.1 SDR family NAD(P)-dependent oxidoreductase [Chitinivibrionales bacterium]